MYKDIFPESREFLCRERHKSIERDGQRIWN